MFVGLLPSPDGRVNFNPLSWLWDIKDKIMEQRGQISLTYIIQKVK